MQFFASFPWPPIYFPQSKAKKSEEKTAMNIVEKSYLNLFTESKIQYERG
jgi:hypothetical protein